MAVHHGFDLFEFNEQLRLFGWRIFSLWWINGYFFNPGTFMLRKTGEGSRITKEAGAPWHFFLAWIGFSFVLWVNRIRLDAPLLDSIPFVLGVVGVSILAHELSHKLVARSLGFKTVFKVWESGLPFSAVFALLGITLLPFYGSTFIRQKDWAYKKELKKMGLIYLAGPVVSLVLASGFLALYQWATTEWLVALGTVGLRTNVVLILFNLLPIRPWGGRRIFLWHKPVWSLLVIWFALLTVAIWYLP
jgi:Zn-dependent protease